MPSGSIIDRVRGQDPDRLNLLAAAVLGVEMQVEVALLDVDVSTRAVLHALLLLLPLAVVIRKRLPVPSVALSQAVFVTTQGMFSKDVSDNLYVPLFLVLVLSVSGAMHAEGRRFWLVPPLTFAGGATGTLIDDYGGSDVADLLWILVIFTGLTAVVGRLLRNRAQLQTALRAKAERLEQDRTQRSEQAALEERARIAGDLHDIIAHALSGMVVQASGARRLADRDPERAREAFAAVEDSGREALAEMRRLLGVLRREDEELALAPTPSLAHVESLVRRVRANGLPVDLDVEGEAIPLPAGVDLTAYRVLQDALGDALDHGVAGRASVTVRYAEGAVELEVLDDGLARHDDDEERLLGIRERVSLVGGEVNVARRRDGGHAVRARLPVGSPA